MKKGKKRHYTEIFLKLIDKPTDERNIEKYLKKWWHDPRIKTTGGLRLSKTGFNFLKNKGIETYKVKLSPGTVFTGAILLSLDKNIPNPYYIDEKNIYLTTQKNALEFILISGDLKRYEEIKKITASKKNIKQNSTKK